jgi:hydroxypyruvate isomerase
MELLNSKRNHKDYRCDHTAWGVEVCKKVGSPRVRLLYDIYHVQLGEIAESSVLSRRRIR